MDKINLIKEKNISNVLVTIRRLAFIILGAFIMAFNINTFVYAAGLIPGGYTGLALLIKELFQQRLNITIPFSVILFIFNGITAAICFKFIGKKFALYSILMIFLSGLMVDFMPVMFINFIQLHDSLLAAIFGGLLNAAAILFCLYADASSGGTDFIAIYISEKYRKDAWNYIFAGNIVILLTAGFLFNLEKALYSIIFQFTTTMTLKSLYLSYRLKTMIIVTSKPDEIYDLIRERTRHTVTMLSGTGMYNNKDRALLYSVVYSNEVTPLINAIRLIDSDAFINVLKTENINGRFFRKPKE